MLYLKRVFKAPASALLIICLSAAASAQGGRGEIISTRVICKQPGRYIGWPSVAKTRDGELLAVFSGDRDEHVCPWGKTQMVRSRDNGRNGARRRPSTTLRWTTATPASWSRPGARSL